MSKYTKHDFKEDFKEFIAYQNMSGQRNSEDNDFKSYHVKKYSDKDISYEYFKDNIIKYFTECIVALFKQNP